MGSAGPCEATGRGVRIPFVGSSHLWEGASLGLRGSSGGLARAGGNVGTWPWLLGPKAVPCPQGPVPDAPSALTPCGRKAIERLARRKGTENQRWALCGPPRGLQHCPRLTCRRLSKGDPDEHLRRHKLPSRLARVAGLVLRLGPAGARRADRPRLASGAAQPGASPSPTQPLPLGAIYLKTASSAG